MLVVDSGHSPSATGKIIAHLKSVTSELVELPVNTHWHQAHIMGNAVFEDEYPKVVILAHAWTAKELEKEELGPGYPKNLRENLPSALERLRRRRNILVRASVASNAPWTS